jgi:hypothetical protein
MEIGPSHCPFILVLIMKATSIERPERVEGADNVVIDDVLGGAINSPMKPSGPDVQSDCISLMAAQISSFEKQASRPDKLS